ncbi:MAG: response regulator transcription factor [Ilumatobacteraceae bacterium]
MSNQAVEPASRSRSRKPDERLLVLVVEDDENLQRVLRTSLEARGLRVDGVGSGIEALRFIGVYDPQLVILDLGLPDCDGIDLCRRIRTTQRCPIIVVTADGDERRMVTALDGGADDYVTKPFGIEVLMARVRVALRHSAKVAAAVEEHTIVVGDLVVDVPAHLATVGGQPIELSPRQFRLLVALSRNVGRILTHQQLAQVAAGGVADQAVAEGLRGAMSQLRKRLGKGPNRPVIVTEPHVGYRLEASEERASR